MVGDLRFVFEISDVHEVRFYFTYVISRSRTIKWYDKQKMEIRKMGHHFPFFCFLISLVKMDYVS